MSREKKSKVDDIIKLRKILDNSSDPNVKDLISADDKALESVRRRLASDTLKPKAHYNHSFHTFDSMEPRVTIRPKKPMSSHLVTPPSRYKQFTTFPEFKSVSPSTSAKSIPSQEFPFTVQDLYEIEKVEVKLPQSTDDSSLPEWQPVDETKAEESPPAHAKLEVDYVPEFEREDTSVATDKVEKTADWEPIIQKEESTETPVEFTVVKSQELQSKKLLKKQEREAKKIKKTKEKEAKRLKKLELKKLKKETREKERKAKQVIVENQDIQYIADETEFIPIKQKKSNNKPKKKLTDSSEWESYFIEKKSKKPTLRSICTYKDYTLYKKVTDNSKEKKIISHFFSKEKPDEGYPVQLPDGYKIAVNTKTGMPYLKKKK